MDCYLPSWKIRNGYFDAGGLLSDQECDWWEELKSKWLSNFRKTTNQQARRIFFVESTRLKDKREGKIDIKALKESLNFLALLEADGIRLRKVGSKYVAKCPFHIEQGASFYVNPEKKSWRCFGACNEWGSVFDYVMRRDGISFREALEVVYNRQ